MSDIKEEVAKTLFKSFGIISVYSGTWETTQYKDKYYKVAEKVVDLVLDNLDNGSSEETPSHEAT